MVNNPIIQPLIEAANGGSAAARQRLFEALYEELHRLARRQLARIRAPMSATTLLHEAYLNLSARSDVVFPDREHFMAYAARAMRGVVIDCVRQHFAQKRGGNFEFTSIEAAHSVPSCTGNELSDVSDALDALATVEPELAELVDLKFFCGLSMDEIAGIRRVSSRTVHRDWEKARIYLYGAIKA
jgi:RNA polymerase sigma factor (TIGR02999 family)